MGVKRAFLSLFLIKISKFLILISSTLIPINVTLILISSALIVFYSDFFRINGNKLRIWYTNKRKENNIDILFS